MPWRGPRYPGELPSLGWMLLDWWSQRLVVPDGPKAGEPYLPTREQAQFILNFYALDPVTGRRRVRRGVLSRPKGWGKSPFVAGICLLEALAPVVPAGWDANGEPVGRSWVSTGTKAKVQVLAASEDQAGNTWEPLTDMAVFLAGEFDLDVMATFIAGPRMFIETSTSSGTSREGARTVFASMDQTESWTKTNGGLKLAGAVRRNLGKVGGTSIETPNSFVPNSGSVSEQTFKAWKASQTNPRYRGDRGGVLFDHREAPAQTSLTDRESLVAGLAVAYGCSAKRPEGCALHGPTCRDGWQELDRTVEEVWDPDTAPADARAYYLNQAYSREGSFLQHYEIRAINEAGDGKALRDKDVVVLGFDGSRGRERGNADNTVLVAIRVTDAHIVELYAWTDETPGAEVPEHLVDTAVADAFKRYTVVGFYADPSKGWSEHVARWTSRYGAKLKVKRTVQEPIKWKTNQHTAWSETLVSLRQAILSVSCSLGRSLVLVQHLANARVAPIRSGITITKESLDSPDKIDGAVAIAYAWACYLAAVAAGAAEIKKRGTVKRIH